jgi:hypothetical protein
VIVAARLDQIVQNEGSGENPQLHHPSLLLFDLEEGGEEVQHAVRKVLGHGVVNNESTAWGVGRRG